MGTVRTMRSMRTLPKMRRAQRLAHKHADMVPYHISAHRLAHKPRIG